MMQFGAVHLHSYWRQTLFQKDKGDTESRTSGLRDYFGIEWTSGVLIPIPNLLESNGVLAFDSSDNGLGAGFLM